jgi:hypothetical protein
MKKCIFCDSLITKSTQSKEHVIPKWIFENSNPEYSRNMEGKWTSFPNKLVQTDTNLCKSLETLI